MSPIKEAVIQMVQSLPDDCTIEDIQYHLYIREKVERGVKAIEEGDVVSEEEADRRIQEWLDSFGPGQRG
jgi:predicted transcriptional regulator